MPSPGEGPELLGFDLSLWLQKPCCGEVLWAYNARHLTFLAEYVGAKLRNQRSDLSLPQSNSALESRLPRWMLSAKNRPAVLRGVKSLRERLVGDDG